MKERRWWIWVSSVLMVHKGDLKIVSQMLKNLEAQEGNVEFKAPLVVAALDLQYH